MKFLIEYIRYYEGYTEVYKTEILDTKDIQAAIEYAKDNQPYANGIPKFKIYLITEVYSSKFAWEEDIE